MGIRRTVALVTLLAYLAGCVGWKDLANTQPVPIPTTVYRLRLTLPAGQTIELHEARLSGDSVLGEVVSGLQRTRTAVALRDIRKGEVYGIRAGRTALVLGILAITIIGVASTQVPWSYSYNPFAH
jgi:hypothetical protein